jgi:hypothetical protein
MRTIRALMAATAVVVALPTIAAAQQGRGFKDSWFWGLKAGGFTMADSGQKYIQAPTVGVDWMITRTHGGLYVSGSETFFSQHSFVPRDPVSPDSGFRPVTLKNLRQLQMMVLGFPGDHLRLHPYVGAGFTLGEVASAEPDGPFSSTDQIAFAQQTIQDRKVAFSPMFMGGVQYRLHFASVFGQVALSPTNSSFILYNGRPWNIGYEFGLRYNFGTSIDRE